MKKIIASLLLTTSTLVYGQCTEQNNFISDIKIDRQTLIINIKQKNGLPFSYYDVRSSMNEKYIGFQFIPEQIIYPPTPHSIEDNFRYQSYIGGVVSKTTTDNATNILINNQKLISSLLDSGSSNRAAIFLPLQENIKKTTGHFSRQINIPSFIQIYRRMLQHNDIYGKHKIKFYITLIHNNDVSKCSTFESPEIEYNFGNYYSEEVKNIISPVVSPIWIIFKHFFGK